MLHEFAEAVRSLAKRPGFAALVVLPLGLGIGAATTVFSAFYGILLKEPPYEDPDRIVQVWERRPRLPNPDEIAAFSIDHFRQWRDANTVFDAFAAYGDRPVAYAGAAASPGAPRPLSVEQVSPALFDVLGVRPAMGRAFLPEEETPGRHRVLVLGHGFWMREFGGDPDVLGRALLLDEEPWEVVGVMPAGFGFPIPTTEAYAPYPLAPPAELQPGQVRLELVQAVARLAPGATSEQAEAEAGALLARLSAESEIESMLNDGVTVHLTSFTERAVRRIERPLWVLQGVTLLVLLIACGNVANLMLTRAGAREQELAVRAALGAGRSRLFRRMFAESVVLAAAAGTLGVVVAGYGVGIVRALTDLGLPHLANASMEGRVLAFNFGIAAVSALGFGVAPALRAASRTPGSALPGATRSGSAGAAAGFAGRGPGGRAGRGLFASAQIALSAPLLIGAGLLIRSFLSLSAASPGYEPKDTVVFDLRLTDIRYPTEASRAALLRRVREELAALPGVLHVGVVDTLPLTGERAIIGFQRLGDEPVTDPNHVPRAMLRTVSPGYFRAMGVPLLAGRTFEDGDAADATRLVVVNQLLVERYLEDEPVGLELAGLGTVVGVVGNVRSDGAEEPAEPILYRLFAAGSMLGPPGAGESGPGTATRHVVIRHAPDARVAAAAAARVGELDSELAALDLRTLGDRIRESVARPRLYALLLGGFALAAALLAAWGAYAVVSHWGASQVSSHGVRMALGARPGDIRRIVLADGARIAAFGIAPGLLLAWLLVQFAGSEISPLLFEVEPLDPAVYVLVPAVLGGAAMLASLRPALTAARVDVADALRWE